MAVMCRALKVSKSGFYAWRRRLPSDREREDVRLKVQIREIHAQNYSCYGSPRILRELRARGVRVGRNRVIRLMRATGIAGCRPRRFRKTTESSHTMPVAENLLERRFQVSAPNRVWATDITFVGTWEGWLYLAVVLDLFSRRVVGWSMAESLRKELVLNALVMALGQRVPESGLMHHSDRGSQYASFDYQKVLETHGIKCSMSRKGDCYDNAVVESFFATLKKELIKRQTWCTRQQARSAIHEYVGGFYNSRRRHSSLGGVSPADFEARYDRQDRTEAA